MPEHSGESRPLYGTPFRGETVPVEFAPNEPGEYEFTRAMGVLRDKLIVE
jgi:plastocyanin domain-containing protein